MNPKVKIQITQEEWAETPQITRNRIMKLMKEYGYDVTSLDVLERDIKEPEINDIYKQFYGDEEE